MVRPAGLARRSRFAKFKILSPASACLRGDRGKIYVPRFKQASSRDEILRRISRNARAHAPAKVVNLARNFIPPHYLAAIKYACWVDAVKFRTALQCALEVKFRAAVLTVHTRNKRSTYRARPSWNTRL